MSLDYQKSPKFNKWLNMFTEKPNTPLYEYISQNIDPEDIFIFIDLVHPDFLIYEGLIFFKNTFSENAYLNWIKKLEGNAIEVQMLLNKLHIYDIFGHHPTHVDDSIYEKIGRFIRDYWEYKCKKEFLRIQVTFKKQ